MRHVGNKIRVQGLGALQCLCHIVKAINDLIKGIVGAKQTSVADTHVKITAHHFLCRRSNAALRYGIHQLATHSVDGCDDST